MLEIAAKLRFDPTHKTKKHYAQASWKRIVVAQLNCDMHLYYAWFLKRRFNLNLVQPLRGAHITIVSDIMDENIFQQAKPIFDKKEIKFQYEPSEIRSNGIHWWLKVYSQDAVNIRTAMGLSPNPYFGLHLTLGHVNDEGEKGKIDLAHSKYILDCIKFYDL